MAPDSPLTGAHLLEEVRGVRAEVNSIRHEFAAGQRDQRVVVDRLREQMNDIHVAMVERNAQREGDHKELKQRVSIYAAAISGGVAVAFSVLRDFFFR